LASSPVPGKRADQRGAARHFLLGEFVVESRCQRLLGNCVDDVRRDHDDAVAVADQDVARIDRHAAAGDRQVEVGRLMDDPTRRR
jgi:hypothetical protein